MEFLLIMVCFYKDKKYTILENEVLKGKATRCNRAAMGEFQNLIIDIVFTQSIFNIRFLNYSQQDKHAYQSFLKKFYREYSR